jgi:hypothetical protein
MVTPERTLQAKFRLCGIPQKKVAEFLQVPYSTLSSWLAGYALMPDLIRIKIEDFLAKQYTGKECQNVK